jgi:hypothetical protein
MTIQYEPTPWYVLGLITTPLVVLLCRLWQKIHTRENLKLKLK